LRSAPPSGTQPFEPPDSYGFLPLRHEFGSSYYLPVKHRDNRPGILPPNLQWLQPMHSRRRMKAEVCCKIAAAKIAIARGGNFLSVRQNNVPQRLILSLGNEVWVTMVLRRNQHRKII
jgi:hypothetical protein